MNINKRDLAVRVAERTGATIKQAEEIIQSALDEIQETVATGHEVNLAGFGKFEVRKRAERSFSNQITDGKPQVIPAHKLPAFKPYKAFKEFVNQ